MPFADAAGVRLHYDIMGDAGAPAVLMTMGVSAPLTRWPTTLRQLIAQAGYQVIRYDNRDSGASHKFDELGLPTRGRPDLAPPYPLSALADDACALLDALGIDRAHAIGASMGGAIVQRMAIGHPERVRSIVSIMSTTGAPGLSPMSPRVMSLLAEAPSALATGSGTWEERVRALLISAEAGRSPGFPDDFEAVQARAESEVSGGFSLAGRARQAAALFADVDRRASLTALRIPALVLHGDADELFPLDHARDTVAAIPGARLVIVPGLGHDLPEAAAPILAATIVEFLAAVDTPA